MKQYLLILIALIVSACSRPFPQQELKKMIETRLDKNFSNSLFTVEEVQRRGSYQYQNIGSSDQSMLLYYRAQVRFNRDYKLSDWEKPNIGSLTYLLGANPQGISGVNVEGNKTGDQLTIHGAINFKKINQQWTEDAPLFTAKKMAAASTPLFVNDQERSEPGVSTPDYKQSLGILQSIFSHLDRNRDQTMVAKSEKLLFDMTQKALMYQSKMEGYTTMATGAVLGNYFQLGRAFSTIFGKENKLKTFSSSGSVENCQLVEEGKADLAVVQSDIAQMAYEGKGIFSDSLPMHNMRAVAALYPEAIMLIVPKDSSITKFKDLVGKRISVGLRGSGNRADAIQLIRAHGLNQSDFASIEELNYEESFKLFSQSKIDALFITAAFPLPSLVDLSQKTPLRLIPIEASVQKKLKQSASWIPLNIPAQLFNGMDHPVATMGVTAILLANKDLSDDKVELLLDSIYKNGNQLVKLNTLAGQIGLQSAGRGINIPIHPAAKKYLKSVR